MTIVLLLLFSLSPNKQDRFILPLFPYIAVMMSGFIWSLPKLRKILITILILFSFLQFFIINYGKNLSISNYKLLRELLQAPAFQKGLLSVIDQGDYQSPAEEIVKIINSNSEKDIDGDKVTNVLFISDRFEIETAIDYQRIVKSSFFNLVGPVLDIDLFILSKSHSLYSNFDATVLNSDFIILQNVTSEEVFATIHARKLFNSLNRNLDKFNFIKAVSFPDNLLCYLYERNDY